MKRSVSLTLFCIRACYLVCTITRYFRLTCLVLLWFIQFVILKSQAVEIKNERLLHILHGAFAHSKQPYATLSNPTPGLYRRTQPYANCIRRRYAVPTHMVRNHTPPYASPRITYAGTTPKHYFFHDYAALLRRSRYATLRNFKQPYARPTQP